MTKDEWTKSILNEARTLGHAEVKRNQTVKLKAAQSLVESGDLVQAGTMSKGGTWYKLSEAKRADYIQRGYPCFDDEDTIRSRKSA